MPRFLHRLSLQAWLLLYMGCVALGAVFLFGGGVFPAQWFAGWHWWQRLLLILLASPFLVPLLVASYVLCEALLEAVFHVLAFFLREHTLPRLVALVAIAGVALAGVGLLSR